MATAFILTLIVSITTVQGQSLFSDPISATTSIYDMNGTSSSTFAIPDSSLTITAMVTAHSPSPSTSIENPSTAIIAASTSTSVLQSPSAISNMTVLTNSTTHSTPHTQSPSSGGSFYPSPSIPTLVPTILHSTVTVQNTTTTVIPQPSPTARHGNVSSFMPFDHSSILPIQNSTMVPSSSVTTPTPGPIIEYECGPECKSLKHRMMAAIGFAVVLGIVCVVLAFLLWRQYRALNSDGSSGFSRLI